MARPAFEQLQPLTPSAQERDRALDAPRRRFQIGDPIPGTCTVADVAWVMEKSASQIYRMTALGQLDAFLLADLGGARRYNGRVLKAWSEGTLTDSHINGDLRKPRGSFKPRRAVTKPQPLLRSVVARG